MSTIVEFWTGRTAVEGPRAARFHGDHDPYDLAAIDELAGPGARVLDLGCGTCVVANRLADEFGCAVHAVDFIPEFLTHAGPGVTTEVGDARSYVADREFDLVLSLGVITYLEDPADREAMYAHCAQMLAPGGALLLKAQFGVDDEVLVDTDSADLGARYRAVYPHLDREVARLESFFDVEVRDPYPASFSRWATTHFHHLVGRPKR